MKIPLRTLPGTSRLVADYIDDFESVAEFYNGDYRRNDDFLAHARALKERELPLSKLIPILKEQNQRYGCASHTLENIDLLLERRASAVVTGQQTGLFGGPLFTLYKVITTIKLASRLSRNCEGCFVPIFWLASEDHDFREVHHIQFLNKRNEPHTLSYSDHPAESRLPVADIKLTESIKRCIEELDEQTHPSEFKDDILSHLDQAYAGGNDFASAFASWLMTLFKPFGLTIIDASDTRIKKLATSLFEQEIREKSPSSAAAKTASKTLEEKGYHAQVALQGDFLNLFYLDPERRSIELTDGSYNVKGGDQNFSESELIQVARSSPERLSPNVLLRPLYQDTLLPTVAYVAGPSELAYYAQMKGIYERFGLPMPIIFPRKSITLLEGKIEKVLDSYDLSLPDLWDDPEKLITRIARERLPDTLEKRLENATACIDKNMEALQKVVIEFEPTLEKMVSGVQNRVSGQLEGLEKKILQAYKKRNDVIRQQIYKAGNALYPDNQLQERALNIVPFLFRHGLPFIDQLYEATDIASFEHQIINT